MSLTLYLSLLASSLSFSHSLSRVEEGSELSESISFRLACCALGVSWYKGERQNRGSRKSRSDTGSRPRRWRRGQTPSGEGTPEYSRRREKAWKRREGGWRESRRPTGERKCERERATGGRGDCVARRSGRGRESTNEETNALRSKEHACSSTRECCKEEQRQND